MNDLATNLEILEKTPTVVRSLLNNLSPFWLSSGDVTDWGPIEIVGHFIHGEKTDWIPRMEIILSDQEDKTFVPFDRFAQFQYIEGKTLEGLLDEFENLRTKNIERLRSAGVEDKMEQTGVHPELGEVTMAQLIATWTAHDLSHISQISRFLARKLTDDVGPWRVYLSVLD